jgi:hypothetical protein
MGRITRSFRKLTFVLLWSMKMANKPGLYANIHAKQERIERQKDAGKTPERMRTPGSKGAPTAAAFKASAKTAKK